MDTRARKGTKNLLNKIHKDGLERPVKGVKRVTGDKSPTEKKPTKRTRTAFGDLTNKDNVNKLAGKKGLGLKSLKPAAKPSKKAGGNQLIAIPKPSATCKSSSTTQQLPGKDGSQLTSSQKSTDLSWDIIELSEDCSSSQSSVSSSQSSPTVQSQNEKNSQLSRQCAQAEPRDWVDIDAETLDDPTQCSLYAAHIFEYYKSREEKFAIRDYLTWQTDLSVNMRAILVDWLVEVQENFELNHETLYLAVKIVDLYVGRKNTGKDDLQLVGATAMFIASKFDERMPPLLDDFLYICDDAYNRDQLLVMERQVLKTIEFDLGIPLSYRYLRRFAKCARMCMVTLTLARYILELSLMDYQLSRMSDAKVAAATLLLAMRMRNVGQWDGTMVHFTGYKEAELEATVKVLNRMLSEAPNQPLTTIRRKYSHTVFHEVAKISPLSILEEL